MIIKRVKSTGGKSKAGRVKGLTDYITDAKGKSKDKDKIAYTGGRGFIGDSFICHQAEMTALAEDATRSTNPITHWMMSWKQGEKPSREQVEQAIDILMSELELKDHQVIYALHQDTDNIHLHLAVNRVHPDTLKVIKSGGGFDIDIAKRAIAKIEDLQGWQQEERGRYQVVDGQTKRVQHPPNPTKEPGQIAQQIESHQGIKSAERIAIETGAELIRAAHSWDDLHDSLADRGMRYEQYGTGAYLYVGETKLKASSAGRDCSLPQVQKRLGAYQQPPRGLNIQPLQPQLMDNLPPERRKYFEQKLKHTNRYQTGATTDIKDRHIEEWRKLKSEQRIRREDLTSISWRGQGKSLNILRAAIAKEQEQERSNLREQQRSEMKEFQVEPFPSFEEWQQANEEREQAIVQERLEQEQKATEQLKSLVEERLHQLEIEDKPEQSYGGISL
jgi:Relaxase/Mobilisation nuclease domain